MAKRPALSMLKGVVYILLCNNDEYYVGSTTNLELRLQEHRSGVGSGFTKAHLPIDLVYTEEYDTIHEARLRERQLHKWSQAKKEALINGDIEKLKELSKSK
jgi:putative endonuclease